MNTKFLKYVDELGDTCPYIRKSKEKNLFNYIDIVLEDEIEENLSKYVFYYSLMVTEKFRKKRLLLEDNDFIYYTENLIFDDKTDDGKNWEKILGWPHYMLKELYSDQQIMFGKFWKGEEAVSVIKGIKLPIPEVNFISIRTAVRSRDPSLLGKDTEFAKIIKNSNINNSNYIPDLILKNINDINILFNSGYYESLKNKFINKLRS